MFKGCASLKVLDIAGMNLCAMYASNSNGTYYYGANTSEMFMNCSALTTIYVDQGWTYCSTNNNWTYRYGAWGYSYCTDMFTGCVSLVGASGYRYVDSTSSQAYGTHAYVGAEGYLCPKFTSGTAIWMLDGAGNLTLQPKNGTYGELAAFANNNATTVNGVTTVANSPWRTTLQYGVGQAT